MALCGSPDEGGPDWYRPGEGVARFDLGIAEVGVVPTELMAGKREGTVPARERRTEFDADNEPGLPVDRLPTSKSGKLSLPGDSGMVSRSGVECPLPVVGGPQGWGERPSCC